MNSWRCAIKQAVILAGGMGTRLSSVVSEVPKPMALIQNKPFLDYLVNILKKNGFDNFVFLIGYKSEIIENYFNNLENAIFIKEEVPLGTGGALLNAYEYLNDEFFVINGDTFFDIDFSLISDFSKDKACTIALRYTDDFARYGVIEIDDEYKIKNFYEKQIIFHDKLDGYINAGIYFFKKKALSLVKDDYYGTKCSVETDLFPVLLKHKLLFGLPIGGVFVDIGIPEDYIIAQKLIPDAINRTKKPALFIDKDGTVIKDTIYPSGYCYKIIASTVNIVKKYYEENYYIVMVTNQAGIAKGKFSIDKMIQGFNSISAYYKNFGLIFHDIEYCPYHKDGIINKYRYDSLLRKPNPGMILKACEKLKIDLKNSIMIGDKENIDKIKLPYLKCKIICSK